jgi:hypothetical protein
MEFPRCARNDAQGGALRGDTHVVENQQYTHKIGGSHVKKLFFYSPNGIFLLHLHTKSYILLLTQPLAIPCGAGRFCLIFAVRIFER